MFAQSFEMCSCERVAPPPPLPHHTGTPANRPPSSVYLALCVSLSQSDCHNYPRVFSRLDNDTRFLLCGTNAFSPRCRFYFKANPWSSNLVLEKEFSGRGFCPYDPRHNSTAIFTGKC